MNTTYDVIVVGAGPAGIFACYELTRKMPHANILLVDKGHDIYSRNCPILQKKIQNAHLLPEEKNLLDVFLPVPLRTALEGQGHILMENLTLQANLAAG